MKLLLCISSLKDITPFLQHYDIVPQKSEKHNFISSAKILHHEVDIVETGPGVYQTSYKVTKALSATKYHLALKIGFGNSYKEDIAIGRVLSIINEKPGDYGMMAGEEWKDHYDFKLVSKEDEPHVRGGFINMTNAYMNVFLPFKKVVGVTVNNYADKYGYIIRRDKYKADCETGDGLGFVYPCLYEKQGFYQLCVIERNLVDGSHDFAQAVKVLNETLVNLLSIL